MNEIVPAMRFDALADAVITGCIIAARMYPGDYPPPPVFAQDMPLFKTANPHCQCGNAMRAFFCHTGHLTECHYPLTCQLAQCGHMASYQA